MKMSLKTVLEKLNTLENTPSTNDKKELLREYLKNGLFRRVVWCALTGTLHYNVSKFPNYKRYGFVKKGNDEIFKVLKQLNNQRGASNADKERLFQAASEDPETYEVVKRICNKDLRCGVAAQLINDVRPGTVKKMPYQRCKTSKYIDNLKFDEGTESLPSVVAEVKADGAFVNIIIDEKFNITFLTRSGEKINMLDRLKAKMLSSPKAHPLSGKNGIRSMGKLSSCITNKVFLGELRVWEKGRTVVMSRKKGNGIITKCRLGTATQDEADRVFAVIWDAIPLKDFWDNICTIKLRSRRFDAMTLVNAVNNDKYLQFIEQYYPKDLNDTMVWYRKKRQDGEEGLVVKNLDCIWKDQSSGSPDMIKVTHVFSCEVKIVGWEYGKVGKKNEKLMGAAIVESSCGKLRCKVGTGFTPEEREWDWDLLVDEISTVEAKEISKSKGNKYYALYTPSFIEIREDRNEADSLERILEIEKESKRHKRNR